MTDFSRREMLLAGAGITGVALARAAPSLAGVPLDLSDPAVALDAYIKLRGSTATETVFQAYEGDIFLVLPGQVPLPAVGFRGIQKSRWRPHPDGGYANEDYDLGVYVDHESRDVLTHWNNPVTGDVVEVVHYRGGPSGGHFRVGAEADDVYGGVEGRWRVAGDQLWHTTSRWGARPNALLPKDWPRASSGETILGAMTLSFSGRVSEVADAGLSMVPSMQVWTNTVSWMPWMEMGQRPGFNLWRWVGAKGVDRGALDPGLVADVERVWPGYVSDDAVWQTPTSGRRDFARLRRGQPLTP